MTLLLYYCSGVLNKSCSGSTPFSVVAIGVEYGDKKISVSDRYSDDPRLLSKTGITFVFESSSDAAYLGTKAAEKVIDGYREKVGVLIVVSQSLNRLLPGISYEIHQNLGLSSDCQCIDLLQGCAGFVQGLILASKLVKNDKCVLLVCTDTYRKKIRPGDRSVDAIFSDAATATLISAESSVCIIGEKHYSDGHGIKHLNQNLEASGGSSFLHMSGSDVFLFTKKIVEAQVRALMCELDLNESKINLFIPHQASKLVVDELATRFLSVRKFVSVLGVSGNTVSSSIPIALEKNLTLFHDGITVLTGFGVGLACSTVILQSV